MKKVTQNGVSKSATEAEANAKPHRNFVVRHKGWFILAIIVAVIIWLMKTNNKYSSPGLYGHLSIPGRFLIANGAQFVGGAGMAIIVLTIIVRLFLMPLMVRQTKLSTRTSMTQDLYKPQTKKIRKDYSEAKHKMQAAKSIDDRKKYKAEMKEHSRELMDFYHAHHLGLRNMGCGAIFLQIPIFGMLYASIRFSPEIQHAQFLGTPLGKSSVAFTAVAFVLYLINSIVIKWNSDTRRKHRAKHKHMSKKQLAQQKQSAKMQNVITFGLPFWIAFITLSTSAGLTLYFCVGGLFVIGQQLYLRHILPKVRKEAKAFVKAHAKKPKTAQAE